MFSYFQIVCVCAFVTLNKKITYLLTYWNFNPLKGTGVRWLHFEVFSAIQI